MPEITYYDLDGQLMAQIANRRTGYWYPCIVWYVSWGPEQCGWPLWLPEPVVEVPDDVQ